jgi:hypothetical protein
LLDPGPANKYRWPRDVLDELIQKGHALAMRLDKAMKTSKTVEIRLVCLWPDEDGNLVRLAINDPRSGSLRK